MDHYHYFSQRLNRLGLSTEVVLASDLRSDAHGFYSSISKKAYQGLINLVIPFVWESNLNEFKELTKIWNSFSRSFYPNPTGGMLGTKELLCYLSTQADAGLAGRLAPFLLNAKMLHTFADVETLVETFHGVENIVLKPMKDYDTKGVYVQPDTGIVREVFENNRDQYMAQEFTSSVGISFLAPGLKETTTHSAIFRMYFIDKQKAGCQAYFIQDRFNGEYFTAPVIAVGMVPAESVVPADPQALESLPK